MDPTNRADEGWTRQSVASEPRLSEAVQTYRSLGFEVRLVPVLQECASEGGAERCTTCFGADEDPERYQVIYTRPGADAVGDGDGLFDAQT